MTNTYYNNYNYFPYHILALSISYKLKQWRSHHRIRKLRRSPLDDVRNKLIQITTPSNFYFIFNILLLVVPLFVFPRLFFVACFPLHSAAGRRARRFINTANHNKCCVVLSRSECSAISLLLAIQ